MFYQYPGLFWWTLKRVKCTYFSCQLPLTSERDIFGTVPISVVIVLRFSNDKSH